MPRELQDADGNKVSVLDDTEIAELQKAKADLDALGANPGVKSLREALERKEALIKSMKDDYEATKAMKKNAEVDEDEDVKMTQEEIMKLSDQAVTKRLINVEVNRELARLPDEQRESVKKAFDKLTAGEEVNEETVHVFIQQALSANNLRTKEPSRTASHGGRPARVTEQSSSFADTPEGKAFANRLGFKTEAPTKK